MESEEIRLLRENNIMLRQILALLQNNQNSYTRDFLINVFANMTADNIQGNYR